MNRSRFLKAKLFVPLVSLACLLATALAIASASANSSKNTVQYQINELLNKLKLAQEHELRTGETVDNGHGGRLFSDQSAVRMEKLHEEIQRQIDALVARPYSERQGAITRIKAFAGKEDLTVEYKNTSKSSYNWNIPVEIYIAGDDWYEVDVRTNEVIQFGPRPLPPGAKPKEYNEAARYTPDELEKMARKFIAGKTTVALDKLTPLRGNKGDTHYFFRWEDTSRDVQGAHPFIQIGFSRGGDILSYTNSLGL